MLILIIYVDVVIATAFRPVGASTSAAGVCLDRFGRCRSGSGCLVAGVPASGGVMLLPACGFLSVLFLFAGSRTKNRNRSARSSKSINRFRAAWVTQTPVGWAVIPARCTRLVSTSITNRTYRRVRPMVSTVKKSSRLGPGGLDLQEIRPPRPASSFWCRLQPVASQDRPDRSRRHPDAELAGFPDDPHITPSRVLPGQAQHQFHGRLGQTTPVASGRRVRPAAGDQLPMPAQQRAGSHEEHRPTLTRQALGQPREQHPVRRRVPRADDLPTQHRQLMSQAQISTSRSSASGPSPTRLNKPRRTINPNVFATMARWWQTSYSRWPEH